MKKFLFLFIACILIASCQQLFAQYRTLQSKYIEFEKNSYMPKGEDIAFLSTLHSSQVYAIEGYASAEGNSAYNHKLATKRAALVADYLTVDTSDIIFAIAGETTIFGSESQNRLVIVRYWETTDDERITDTKTYSEPVREKEIPSSFSAYDNPQVPTDTIYIVDTIRLVQRDTIIQQVKILPLNDAVRYLMRHKKMTRRQAWEYIRNQDELLELRQMEWEKNPIRKVSYTRPVKLPSTKRDKRWIKRQIIKVFPHIFCRKKQ